MTHRAQDERGMALVLVLWFLLVLGTVAAAIFALQQNSVDEAIRQKDHDRALTLADEAVLTALVQLLREVSPGQNIAPFSLELVQADGNAVAHVQAEETKPDANTVQEENLRRLLSDTPNAAQVLLDARARWQDAVSQVEGFDARLPAIMDVSSHLSREGERRTRGVISPHHLAMSLPLQTGPAPRDLGGKPRPALRGTFAIESQARTATKTRASRWVVVRIYGYAGAPRYHILEWK